VPRGILSYMNIAGGSIGKNVTILGIDTVQWWDTGTQ